MEGAKAQGGVKFRMFGNNVSLRRANLLPLDQLLSTMQYPRGQERVD